MRYVDLYLNHPNFPLGQQRVLVTSEGPKWVELFSPFSLARGRIPTLIVKEPTLGETWPETGARDVPDVPLRKLLKIAHARYADDRRSIKAAKLEGRTIDVLSRGKYRKPVKRLIKALGMAAEKEEGR